ncbi:DUF543 domain-containing protein [Chloropicon primus]|nr:DUF543 domain-containing protein [Chloropicon primus]
MGQQECDCDKVVESVVRRGIYGALAGASAALLLFRRPCSRASVFTFGLGCGMGASYSDFVTAASTSCCSSVSNEEVTTKVEETSTSA